MGIDVVEIDRVRRAVENPRFIERVYTEKESAYCQGRGKSGVASFAGRFAAKEAVLKAFGTGLRDGQLTDIEIINDDLGCPKLYLHGYFKQFAEKLCVKRMFISISHAREYATAQCILEG